jgi:signal transduction histidine kinase
VRRRDEFISPDGRPVCLDAIPFAGGAILVLEDLGPRLEQEREMARVKRLAEIGQMTAAIAHELRNPLTSIRGAAQMMRSETKIERAREWAEVVLEEVADLERLCNEFLDFARPVEVAPEEVNLAELVGEVLAHDAAFLRQAKVVVSYSRGKREPIIMGDSVRLSQAVRNLIRNAVEAMPEGGRLTVSVSKSAKGVRLSIADEGEGMTEEQLGRLFTPFYTTKPHGTGLGLCNVKKTVEAHRGSMDVKSKRGKGTTVTMVFPGGRG